MIDDFNINVKRCVNGLPQAGCFIIYFQGKGVVAYETGLGSIRPVGQRGLRYAQPTLRDAAAVNF
jgi:hypothetical protein